MTRSWERHKAVSVRKTVHGLFALLAAVALSSALVGCAERGFEQLRTEIEAHGHYIDGVPFIRQHEADCGPAALASVLAYWKQPVGLADITAAVYLPELRGTLPMDLERYARSRGFAVSGFAGYREKLIESIRADQPVICLLDLGFSVYKQPHYVTVIGFDSAAELFIAHDGGTANRTLSYAGFERAWDRAGHWMIVVTPKRAE